MAVAVGGYAAQGGEGNVRAACAAIDAHSDDLAFWSELLRHQFFVAFFEKALRTKVRRDAAAAALVVGAAAAAASRKPRAAAAQEDCCLSQRQLPLEPTTPATPRLGCSSAWPPCGVASSPVATSSPLAPASGGRRCSGGRKGATRSAATVGYGPTLRWRRCGGALGAERSPPQPSPPAAPAPASAGGGRHGRARRPLPDDDDSEAEKENVSLSVTPAKRARTPTVAPVMLTLPTPARQALASPPAEAVGFAPAPPQQQPLLPRRRLADAFLYERDNSFADCGSPAKTPRRARVLTPARAEVTAMRAPAVCVPSADRGKVAAEPPAGSGGFVLSLPAAVSAQFAAFLDFGATARLALVARGAGAILEHGLAWEPLELDRSASACLLRHLRRHDPVGSLAPESLPVPKGLLRVCHVRVDLMDPDAPDEAENSACVESLASTGSTPQGAFGSAVTWNAAVASASAGGGFSASAAVAAAGDSRRVAGLQVLDPLEELCRRLRRSFPSVATLEVSNIEDHRLDYRFLNLRSTVLGDFRHVRVRLESTSTAAHAVADAFATTASLAAAITARDALGMDMTGGSAAALSPGRTRYSLLAAKVAPVTVRDLEARPPDVPPAFLLAPGLPLDPAEKAFVEEHTGAFKSGDAFHIAHAPWRSFPGEAVRRRYNALLRAFHGASDAGAVAVDGFREAGG
eukprot:TRINITY_DN31437_c0_g1_i1.p1 TRINITY_DN31437_c0_g1~~TRINITY_DN31437_c0_g1_i1.p1  ORF type:complete len:700 (+),score=157.17 TRINITY_DN31437_c0_g1_i1:36-2102(+)